MTNHYETPHIELISINHISVLNPRERNNKVFQQIVDSISKVGLKKPITVSVDHTCDDETLYQLVCGQGRLEAYISLAQKKIPAIIINASEEDRLIMSLVENLARRQHRPLELLQDISALKKRGYSEADIARKTGLTREYTHSITHLLEKGEERLLVAVEAGQIPLSVALNIAETDLEGAQVALAQAYEKGLLRGKKLLTAKRVIERRHRRGKSPLPFKSLQKREHMSADALVRAYQKETDRQHLMVKKANITQNRLLFIVEAMRTLLHDENFITLLRAENLSTMPDPLANLIATKQGRYS